MWHAFAEAELVAEIANCAAFGGLIARRLGDSLSVTAGAQRCAPFISVASVSFCRGRWILRCEPRSSCFSWEGGIADADIVVNKHESRIAALAVLAHTTFLSSNRPPIRARAPCETDQRGRGTAVQFCRFFLPASAFQNDRAPLRRTKSLAPLRLRRCSQLRLRRCSCLAQLKLLRRCSCTAATLRLCLPSALLRLPPSFQNDGALLRPPSFHPASVVEALAPLRRWSQLEPRIAALATLLPHPWTSYAPRRHPVGAFAFLPHTRPHVYNARHFNATIPPIAPLAVLPAISAIHRSAPADGHHRLPVFTHTLIQIRHAHRGAAAAL